MGWRHRQLRRAVGAYVDDELAVRDRLWVVAHLRACPGCRELAAALRGIKEALRGIPGTSRRSVSDA
ncbi:anti-sigma factor family protein [Amycolatopsis echigonensis]|uniref:anti-sigma factor family protein n=1 Tax=Amycolatopsis echigonensis TaxID=2576905 RepID=UPI000C70DA1C